MMTIVQASVSLIVHYSVAFDGKSMDGLLDQRIWRSRSISLGYEQVVSSLVCNIEAECLLFRVLHCSPSVRIDVRLHKCKSPNRMAHSLTNKGIPSSLPLPTHKLAKAKSHLSHIDSLPNS
jgi:hypothetical protein